MIQGNAYINKDEKNANEKYVNYNLFNSRLGT